jgi:diguanylate cyclase (GGDEF)-like protein
MDGVRHDERPPGSRMTASPYQARPNRDDNVVPIRPPAAGDDAANGLPQFDPDAEHDPLTGLIGRRPFEDSLRGAAQRRRGGENPWVATATLDGVADVGARYGLDARTQLLTVMSERLRDSMREGDKIARIGENIYGIIVDAPRGDEAMAALERLLSAVKALSESDRRWGEVRLTAGLALLWGEEPHEAMARAREALLRARDRGGGIVMMSTAIR